MVAEGGDSRGLPTLPTPLSFHRLLLSLALMGPAGGECALAALGGTARVRKRNQRSRHCVYKCLIQMRSDTTKCANVFWLSQFTLGRKSARGL